MFNPLLAVIIATAMDNAIQIDSEIWSPIEELPDTYDPEEVIVVVDTQYNAKLVHYRENAFICPKTGSFVGTKADFAYYTPFTLSSSKFKDTLADIPKVEEEPKRYKCQQVQAVYNKTMLPQSVQIHNTTNIEYSDVITEVRYTDVGDGMQYYIHTKKPVTDLFIRVEDGVVYVTDAPDIDDPEWEVEIHLDTNASYQHNSVTLVRENMFVVHLFDV